MQKLMNIRLLTIASALLLAAILMGCGPADDEPEEVYEDVRAEYLGTANGSIIVDHEEVPDLMEPMLMTLPLEDPEGARELEPEDPIAFDLLVNGSDMRVDNIELLPDTVELELAEPEERPESEEND